MSREIVFLILGMSLVTYLPRALPAAAAGRLRLHAKAEKFLRLIPYTAMAALLFPGVLEVDPSRPEIGIAGGLAAGVLAWRGCPVILCVVSAIGVDLLLYLAG